jgi:hypothetical protein
VLAYTARQVAEVRARYSGFFGAIRGRLDHGWAFEDTDAGYLLLDGLRLKHEATRLARFPVEDFTQYAVERKPRPARVMSSRRSRRPARALSTSWNARAASASPPSSRPRSWRAWVARRPPHGSLARPTRSRCIGSRCRRRSSRSPTRDWSWRPASNTTTAAPPDWAARACNTRSRWTPNEVRRLPVGVCFAIRAGQAATVRVTRAPELAHIQLPERRSRAARHDRRTAPTPHPMTHTRLTAFGASTSPVSPSRPPPQSSAPSSPARRSASLSSRAHNAFVSLAADLLIAYVWVGPLALSLLARAGLPGGALERFGLRARRLSARERDALTDALSHLPATGRAPRRIYAIDAPQLNAFVIGDVLYVNRSLEVVP